MKNDEEGWRGLHKVQAGVGKRRSKHRGPRATVMTRSPFIGHGDGLAAPVPLKIRGGHGEVDLDKGYIHMQRGQREVDGAARNLHGKSSGRSRNSMFLACRGWRS